MRRNESIAVDDLERVTTATLLQNSFGFGDQPSPQATRSFSPSGGSSSAFEKLPDDKSSSPYSSSPHSSEDHSSTSSQSFNEEEWAEIEEETRKHTNCEGELKRRMMFGKWKTRHFLLSEGRLFEFKCKTSKNPVHIILLKDCTVTDASAVVNKPNVICLSSPNKEPIFLQASTEDKLALWLDGMKKWSIMVENPGKTIQSSQDATVVADRNGRISDVNKAAEKLFGYRREELIGSRVTILMFDNIAKVHNQYMKNYLKTGDRKLIGKPRNLIAKHKMDYEIPVTIVMGEFIDKGKRFFIAVFKDLRTDKSDPRLAESIQTTKQNIFNVIEKELTEFSAAFSANEKKKRYIEEENTKLKLKRDENKSKIDEYKRKIAETEKLVEMQRKTNKNFTRTPAQTPQVDQDAGPQPRGGPSPTHSPQGSFRIQQVAQHSPHSAAHSSSLSEAHSPSSAGSGTGGIVRSGSASGSDSSGISRTGSLAFSKTKPDVKKQDSKVWVDFSNVAAVEKISDGHGVGADVYQCIVDGFQCAMKIISTKNCNEKKLKHLLSEIEILESLPFHPNICRYLFHDIEGDNVRLFMTKYSASLQWKIEDLGTNGKKFKAKEIADISINILNALIFLHERGIVHRDLKCDNVFCMLNEDENILSVALGDFDSAKNLEIDKGKTVIGTPGYTAPEILKASSMSEYDEKVDMFSFGMVLYELLTLKRPYHDVESIPKISQMILAGIKPKLLDLPAEYKVLTELHQLCTSQDPNKRISAKDAKKGLLQAYW